ncbi:MAG: beta-ketoacyl-[acyl-carrier-protein] synthase family protein [Verrucomicrobia bacterium]|nr:beta-ketoacyl-[acyl-carrier-protein] synthase family protein [Verrucomicrobiota bacterium]
MKQRVVITGLGLCTPVGGGAEEFWRNLLAGRSGVGPVTLFDASSLPVRIGGEVKGFSLARVAEKFPEADGEQDRKIWLGLEAASQAVEEAGLSREMLAGAPLFVGVSLETFFLENVAPVAQADDAVRALVQQVLARPHAGRLQTPLDRTSQLLGDHYGFARGRYTNCSACAAGAQVIGEAFRRLRGGAAEVALAGATDSVLNPLGLGGFSLLHILSTENEEPTRACRPFDATRQGTVLSEGAAFVVLETLDHAQRRGARAYAEVVGYGSSLDAFRVTDPEPNGRGAALSMTRALADAGLRPEEIDSVNAHGTGTPKNDVAETLAIKQALGARAGEIPVTANKSMTGHMIAASGAVEAVASALTLATGKIPPTINWGQPDPQCDLDYVAEGCRDFAGRTVLSNSFGFGGQNATLIFRRIEP